MSEDQDTSKPSREESNSETPLNDPAVSLSKTQNRNMEVHHHPSVENKSFKEYLLEGLMIFIAVTMGFFAETIREDITEHSRAKQYASSMLKDLEADTSELKKYHSYFSYAVNKIDTFMTILREGEPKNINSGELYWYGLFGASNTFFVSNDATFQEMKSSGSLRFFEGKIEIDLVKYDRLYRYLQSLEQMNQGLYTELRKCRAMFFDFKYLDAANNLYQQSKRTSNQASIDSFLKSNPPLLSSDRVLFNQYVELTRGRFLRTYNIAYSDSLIRQASLIISELKKEYDLQN